MFPFLVLPAVLCGIFMSFYFAAYAMVRFEDDPWQRVAYLWTVLACSVSTVAFSTFLLPTIITNVLIVYVSAKFFMMTVVWNHRNVVHWKYNSDE